MHTIFPIYYAEFEVGSGFSGLKIIPADGLPLAQNLAILPIFLTDGDLTTLLKGCDPEALQALDVSCQEWGGLTRAEAARRLLLEWHRLHRSNRCNDMVSITTHSISWRYALAHSRRCT